MPETVAGREYALVREMLDGVITGTRNWNLVDERFGAITWPSEEFSFLRIACEADRFYSELRDWVRNQPDLVEQQRNMLVRPEPGKEEQYAREVVWYGRKGTGGKLRTRAA